MKKLLLSALILGNFAAYAQPDKPEKPELKEKVEKEEIVIQNNGSKTEVTVKINGDEITVNGKPLAEFKNDEIKINKRKIMICDGEDAMTFDFGGGAHNFKDFIKEWKEDKEEKKTFLGIVSEKTEGGIKVMEVVKESAAEKAGLKEGDIITKVGDEKVTTPEALSAVIRSKKPNEEVKISYKRDNKEKTIKAKLGEHIEKKKMAFAFSSPHGGYGPEVEMQRADEQRELSELQRELSELQRLGVPMEDMPFPMPPMPPMPPRQKKIGLKIQDTEEGGNVKVIAVEDSSAAAIAGIKKDDLITEIDGKKINNTDDARERLSPEEGKSTYKIKALRNGVQQNFEIKIPKNLKTANL